MIRFLGDQGAAGDGHRGGIIQRNASGKYQRAAADGRRAAVGVRAGKNLRPRACLDQIESPGREGAVGLRVHDGTVEDRRVVAHAVGGIIKRIIDTKRQHNIGVLVGAHLPLPGQSVKLGGGLSGVVAAVGGHVQPAKIGGEPGDSSGRVVNKMDVAGVGAALHVKHCAGRHVEINTAVLSPELGESGAGDGYDTGAEVIYGVALLQCNRGLRSAAARGVVVQGRARVDRHVRRRECRSLNEAQCAVADDGVAGVNGVAEREHAGPLLGQTVGPRQDAGDGRVAEYW